MKVFTGCKNHRFTGWAKSLFLSGWMEMMYLSVTRIQILFMFIRKNLKLKLNSEQKERSPVNSNPYIW